MTVGSAGLFDVCWDMCGARKVASVQRERPISLHEPETGSLFDVWEKDCDVGMEGTVHAPI